MWCIYFIKICLPNNFDSFWLDWWQSGESPNRPETWRTHVMAVSTPLPEASLWHFRHHNRRGFSIQVYCIFILHDLNLTWSPIYVESYASVIICRLVEHKTKRSSRGKGLKYVSVFLKIVKRIAKQKYSAWSINFLVIANQEPQTCLTFLKGFPYIQAEPCQSVKHGSQLSYSLSYMIFAIEEFFEKWRSQRKVYRREILLTCITCCGARHQDQWSDITLGSSQRNAAIRIF